jgi:hypothetical protein
LSSAAKVGVERWRSKRDPPVSAAWLAEATRASVKAMLLVPLARPIFPIPDTWKSWLAEMVPAVVSRP